MLREGEGQYLYRSCRTLLFKKYQNDKSNEVLEKIGLVLDFLVRLLNPVDLRTGIGYLGKYGPSPGGGRVIYSHNEALCSLSLPLTLIPTRDYTTSS